MHIQLSYESGTRVAVLVNGQPSHTFDRSDLRHLPLVWRDAPAHGAALYRAMFPAGSTAERSLQSELTEIDIQADDISLQTTNWEYMHDGKEFLASRLNVVRVAPRHLRLPASVTPAPLHILAACPLGDAQWTLLSAAVASGTKSAVLEPVQPPTLDGLGAQLKNVTRRVLHLVTDATKDKEPGLMLLGDTGLEPIKSDDLSAVILPAVEVIILSQIPAEMPAANNLLSVADKLMRKQAPGVLVVPFALPEPAEMMLWSTLYNAVASGHALLEAVAMVRKTLADSSEYSWVAFAPALFSCWEAAIPGFQLSEGTPVILTAPMPAMIERAPAQDYLNATMDETAPGVTQLEDALQSAIQSGDKAAQAAARMALGAGYEDEGRPELAAPQYDQAQQLFEGLSDVSGQASALLAAGSARLDMGEHEAALAAFERALALYRTNSNRDGEAAALNHLVVFYYGRKDYPRALALSDEVSHVYEETGDMPSLASSLLNQALLMVDGLGKRDEAAVLIRRSVDVMRQNQLTTDASGLSLQEHLDFLAQVENGDAARQPVEERGGLILRADQQQMIADNTVAAMTIASGQRQSWKTVLQQAMEQAHGFGAEGLAEVAFFEALIRLVDGQPVDLPVENPYSRLMSTILQRIETAGSLQTGDGALIPQEELQGLVHNTIVVMTTDSDKAEVWKSQLQDARAKADELGRNADVEIFDAILMLMDGQDAALPQGHPYASVLTAIRQGTSAVAPGGSGIKLPDEQLRIILMNTVAVMTGAPDRREEWRAAVQGALEQAQASEGWMAETEFFQAVLAVLDGKPYQLPEAHPYAAAVASLLLSIEEAGRQDMTAAASGIGDAELAAIQRNTIAVMTEAPQMAAQWRAALAGTLSELEGKGGDWQTLADFFRALVGLMDGQVVTLPSDHPYAAALEAVVDGAADAREALAARQQLAQSLPTPPAIVPEDFVARCVAGLKGGQDLKRALFEYLQSVPAGDPQVAALLKTLQRALLGDPLSRLGGDLEGDAAVVWGMVRDHLT